jgi:hypothetical protein
MPFSREWSEALFRVPTWTDENGEKHEIVMLSVPNPKQLGGSLVANLPQVQKLLGGLGQGTKETPILLEHLESAIAQFGKVGFTRNQTLRLAESPKLRAAFRGERIDTFFKEAVRYDARLGHLQVTPRFTFGPDVYNPATRVWWDATTPSQWQSHVNRYTREFGTGNKLLYGGP